MDGWIIIIKMRLINPNHGWIMDGWIIIIKMRLVNPNHLILKALFAPRIGFLAVTGNDAH